MIKIIAIGKIKEKAMVSLIQEFEKRLKHIHKIEMIELNNSIKPDSEVQVIIDDECSRIMSRIDSRDYVILLDLKGDDLSSPQMSDVLMKKLDSGLPITFVIGGSHGVNEEMRARSNMRWRISNLTFPHQLVRLMLYEQVYRMFMIANKHPYHK